MEIGRTLVHGSVSKTIAKFSIPFLLSSLAQNLYSVVDMIIVGQYSGAYSLAGVNISGLIILLITNLVIGLCAGATVLIAQYLTAGSRYKLATTISTLFSGLFVLAILVMIFVFLFNSPLLYLLRTPLDAFLEARSYLIISTGGILFIFGYNALTSVMRGMGDSRTPLYFVLISSVINIILDLWLIAGLDLGASGAATATVFSQALSMILCVMYLKRRNFIFDFKPQSFAIEMPQLGMLLRIGLPTSIQNIVTDLSFLFLIAIVNTFGIAASAALGAASRIVIFAIMPAVTMMSAISIVAAQNIGANEPRRAARTMRAGMIIACSICAVMFLVIQYMPVTLLKIFTTEQAVITSGVIFLSSFSFYFLLAPVFFSLNGLFIGAGHTRAALFISLLSSVIVRVPLAFLFGLSLEMGVFGVGLSAPIAAFVAILFAVSFYFSGKWKTSPIVSEGYT